MIKHISLPLGILVLFVTLLSCKASSNTASTQGNTPSFDIIAYYNGDGSDLVSGFSTVTGHHTPLFSTESQEASADHGVRQLKSLGVPANKIVIGAAFYARTWVNVANINTGLYQKGKFKSFVPYKNFSSLLTPENDFVFYRDLAAQAPYAYSASRNEFATFDDVKSVEAKTRFAKAKGLGGIMFWQLGSDMPENGLLDAIYKVTRGPDF